VHIKLLPSGVLCFYAASLVQPPSVFRRCTSTLSVAELTRFHRPEMMWYTWGEPPFAYRRTGKLSTNASEQFNPMQVCTGIVVVCHTILEVYLGDVF
jgi:hypothetical protein